MSENETVTDAGPELVEKLTELVRATACMICSEQPDMPRPGTLRDLDSFTVVQVLLELEKSTGVMMLEELEDIRVETFGDLATDIVRIAEQGGSRAELAESVLRASEADGACQGQSTSA